MRPHFDNIDAYIATFPTTTQATLQAFRQLVQTLVPTAKETISYQMPTFTLFGNLVHFAGYQHHIGFYPGAKTIAHFAPQLQAYKHAKGSVQFPLKAPLPTELISEMVLYKAALDTHKYEQKRISSTQKKMQRKT